MSALSEEQTLLLRLCLKNSEPLKPSWQPVAEGLGDSVSTNAASQRWGRLYKILVGDDKSRSPSKGKGAPGSTSKVAPKKPKAADQKSSTAKADVASPGRVEDSAQDESIAQPTTPTSRKKRAREGDEAEDLENETPTKLEKTEIKEEIEDGN